MHGPFLLSFYHDSSFRSSCRVQTWRNGKNIFVLPWMRSEVCTGFSFLKVPHLFTMHICECMSESAFSKCQFLSRLRSLIWFEVFGPDIDRDAWFFAVLNLGRQGQASICKNRLFWVRRIIKILEWNYRIKFIILRFPRPEEWRRWGHSIPIQSPCPCGQTLILA